MTIISNSFSLACRLLLSKYTISTLRSIDIVDNQKDYGCILKFSRFSVSDNRVFDAHLKYVCGMHVASCIPHGKYTKNFSNTVKQCQTMTIFFTCNHYICRRICGKIMSLLLYIQNMAIGK